MTSSIATVFDNHPVTFVMFRGEPIVAIEEMGTALGYAPGNLRHLVRNEWAADFVEGKDYHLLAGEALAEFKALDRRSETPLVASRARALLVLTESGLYAIALKTEKSLGVRLRRFLVDEVLPKLARGESVGSSKPTLPSAEVRAWFAEQRRAADLLLRAGDKAGARAILTAATASVLGMYDTDPVQPSLSNVTPLRPAKPIEPSPLERFVTARLVADPAGFAFCREIRLSFNAMFPREPLAHADLGLALREIGARPGHARRPDTRASARGWKGVRLKE
jgi:prophage antirepressor-like protein